MTIEIDHTTDPEDEDWQYALINLVFNAEFSTADRYLHHLYGKLDKLASNFDKRDQDIFRGQIYLDVKTTVPSD